MSEAHKQAEAHWSYVKDVLKTHGEDDDVIDKIGFHYVSAMVHGHKHGVEGDWTGVIMCEAVSNETGGQTIRPISSGQLHTPVAAKYPRTVYLARAFEDWTYKHPWGDAPTWAAWATTACDGEKIWFEHKPTICERAAAWQCLVGAMYAYAAHNRNTPNWRDSLEARPGSYHNPLSLCEVNPEVGEYVRYKDSGPLLVAERGTGHPCTGCYFFTEDNPTAPCDINAELCNTDCDTLNIIYKEDNQ